MFLAWIEFGVFIRKLPHIGIYLIMFVYIVKTFAIIAIPALLLVVAFSISFYMVFFIPTASFAVPKLNYLFTCMELPKCTLSLYRHLRLPALL